MNIDAIRQIPLVDFLNHLGYQPTSRDSKCLWFYSPLRNERKPSFHVNPRKGVWFDFGSGAGGDIFTLAGELAGTTDFIKQAEFIAQKMQLPVEKPYKPAPFVEQPTFDNVEISRLESPILLNYLADRGIPRDIAQRYCVQVDYTLHGSSRSAFGAERRKKRYYAIGFENNAHGYALRNSFFKGAFPPQHISHISNGNARCNVFEGFIDFLSAERLGLNDGNDSVVLNSVSNLNKAIPYLQHYPLVLCYLDNDVAGRAAVARLQREFGDRVADKSSLYPQHKDLNDYLKSLSPKQSTTQKSKLKL